MHHCKWSSPKYVSINHWKVTGVLVEPNGILSHSQNPKGPTVKALSGLLSSSNSTCQYPALVSNDVNHWDPFKQSRVSVILGRL